MGYGFYRYYLEYKNMILTPEEIKARYQKIIPIFLEIFDNAVKQEGGVVPVIIIEKFAEKIKKDEIFTTTFDILLAGTMIEDMLQNLLHENQKKVTVIDLREKDEKCENPLCPVHGKKVGYS